jgi:hypothetical protein
MTRGGKIALHASAAHYSFSVCIMEIRKLLLSLILLQILAERERNFKRLLLVDGVPKS